MLTMNQLHIRIMFTKKRKVRLQSPKKYVNDKPESNLSLLETEKGRSAGIIPTVVDQLLSQTKRYQERLKI